MCRPRRAVRFAGALLLWALLGLAQASEPVEVAIAEVSPWGYRDVEGKPAGMLVTLARRLGEEADVAMRLHLLPTSRTVSVLRAGEMDFSVLFDSPAAASLAEPVVQVVSMRVVVIGAAEGERAAGLDELAGQRVGFIRGAWYGNEFQSHPEIQRVVVSDAEHGLALFDAGRISALVMTDIAATTVKRLDDEGRYAVWFTLPKVTGSLYMAPSSDRRAAREALVQAVEQLRQRGELAAIFGERYPALSQ